MNETMKKYDMSKSKHDYYYNNFCLGNIFLNLIFNS